MRKPAPIVLFAFNRPDHVRSTVEALLKNELASESDLIIYCDGPRSDEEKQKTDAVFDYVSGVKGFRSLDVARRNRNWGLAPSVIDGVTQVVNAHGSVIVLEDDLVTSPYFLRYMNDGLCKYADNEKIASVVGWIPPLEGVRPPETFFLKGTDCWGWGTWSRAWMLFEPDTKKLLLLLKERELESAFNGDGSMNNTGILGDFIAGRISTWALRWDASVFLADMYSLFPGRPLVDNIGLDGSGRHGDISTDLKTPVSSTPVTIWDIPVLVNEEMRVAINEFFRGRKGMMPSDGGGTPTSWRSKAYRRLGPALRKLKNMLTLHR